MERIKTQSLEWPRILVVLLGIVITVWYLWWRLDTFNAQSIIFSYVLYVAECFGFFMLMLHVIMLWKLSVRQSPPIETGMTVDVLIPTFNEPEHIIRRTALSALNMDYAHTTYILDDGNRPEIKALAEEIGCKYLARDDNEHAKAGNLNYGLDHSTGDFIAIFDADHAPKKTFLTHTLGYFSDPEVGFVQTPQDFYNLDSYQHRSKAQGGKVWTEQSVFFRIIQRGKDSRNAAFFCGSCAVIRRTTLDDIGGIATGTITEDLHTSIRVHKAGYKSVYHAESLAFGIAPAQVDSFLSQRVRWGQGAMQVWRKENILFTTKLNFTQRVCYLASILTYFEGWQKGVYYVAPAIVLLTGWMPIETTTREFLWHFIPYFFSCLWVFTELSRGYGKVMLIEQYNMARFFAFCRSSFGFFMPSLRFRVTQKNMNGGGNMWWHMFPQYSVMLLNAAGIVLGVLMYVGHVRFGVTAIKDTLDYTPLSPFAFTANLIWALINLLVAAILLLFSLERASFRRNDYRFAIPLSANVQLPGQTTLAAVGDISSSGMQLTFANGAMPEIEEMITGHLYLPEGPLPFTAKVRALHDVGYPYRLKRMGCELVWSDNKARNRLETFLHGSNLEWQVRNLNERSATPIEIVLGPLVKWHIEDFYPHAEGANPVATLVYPAGPDSEAKPAVFLTGGDKEHNALIAFSPLILGSTVETKIFTPRGWESIRGRVSNQNDFFAGEPVYCYQFEGIKT